jgi:hypothetical protein
MRKTLGMLGIAALVAAPAVLGFTSVAGAAPAGHVALAHSTAVRFPTVPNSNIKGAGKYSPKTLAGTWTKSSEPAKGCTDKSKFTFSITNKSSVSQTVTYESADFVTIPPGELVDVCTYGTGTYAFVFGLTSTSKTLTVNVS